MTAPKIIELTEYAPKLLPREEIPYEMGRVLWQNYQSQVEVRFPDPTTDDHWRLTPLGWVGYISLAPELGLDLRPRVALDNIFRMLEYAYRLKSFRFLEGLKPCRSLEEFYERLAHILARRILDRARKGFYRTYLQETERLPYIRGRLDVQRAIQAPWEVKLRCHYEEHTGDIEENQILAWTLNRIARSGRCSERVLPTIRKAYRVLQGFVTLTPCGPQHCVRRLYNRLNEDYQPLHALCRFFLEHSGPSHELGDRTMLPFLVNMPRLYELFVAEWLKAHLPGCLQLRVQEKVSLDSSGTLHFNVDLVLCDAGNIPLCVLDTKYKTGSGPSPDDVGQVIAYAEAIGCREAILVYPGLLERPLDEYIGSIRVRSLTFAIQGNLAKAGQAFLQRLNPAIE
jgi:5-methylcytosine-specific restriction enzyme subunit McrC